MNQETCGRLHSELDNLIAEWAKSHNMAVTPANCSFNDKGLTYKIDLHELAADGSCKLTPFEKKMIDEEMTKCGVPGLDPFGKVFPTGDRRPKHMRVVGFDLNKRYPWRCVDVKTGKNWEYAREFLHFEAEIK